MTTPYVSWILANRNDGYGGDHEARISCFIDYLAWIDRSYPGIFELVVCDWNPPAPDRTMIDGFDWSKIENVTFLSVSPEIHAARVGSANTPILDYVARNVAIRAAQGHFIGVLNQDIYPTSGIVAFLAARRLNENCFYRADRCDFVPDFARMRNPASVESYARGAAFRLHRRGQDRSDTIVFDIPKGADQSSWIGSRPITGEVLTGDPNLIFALDDAQEADRRLTHFISDVNKGYVTASRTFTAYGLHTSASGDFVIASKRAFQTIHGFVETNEFYMHTDSYGMAQLRAAGYTQRIFALPEVAFHADHDRSARDGRREAIAYDDHEKAWSDMLLGVRSPQLNGEDWGLGGVSLPTVRMRFGRRL
jgi:GT2 family glycosyltransferase